MNKNPALVGIFIIGNRLGSLFQSVMNRQARRNLGAHYTSERDILRLIRPLFLDELHEEFSRIKPLKAGKQQKLINFQQHLSSLQFLDPACGCGNFLIITYRELRRLELAILEEQNKDHTHSLISIEPLIRLDCFHGIEIEEWPARIAEVAMWLTQHQMNREFAKKFGHEPDLLPLKTAAHIVHDNALRLDWHDVVPLKKLNFILGNPPFGGAKYMQEEQRRDIARVFHDVSSAGLLDFVAAWYRKAANFMVENPTIKTAFVSTNSITQGEQVSILWLDMFRRGVKIHFAYRTFQWSSEARGKAAVHCVIIGFALHDTTDKKIFDFESPQAEPYSVKASNINPYLVDAPDVVVSRRNTPLCAVPRIGIGNKPIDGGHYLFTPEERDEFLKKEPTAAAYFRRWLGSVEFINGYERWCIWLGDCSPDILRRMPEAMKRVAAVRRIRLASKSAPTRKLADTPTRFHVENMPVSSYLVIPEISSERMQYILIGFLEPETLASNKLRIFLDATLYHFGVLSSAIHMTWMRYTTGRLKSDYQYSVSIVYNNFPWPEANENQKQAIEKAAQKVLAVREEYPDSALADLYDPLTMLANLRKAHSELDKLVEQAYRNTPFKDDSERIKFLFERYQALVDAEK